MIVLNNVYIHKGFIYDEHGLIVPECLRIPFNHKNNYWNNYHQEYEKTMNYGDNYKIEKLNKLVYIGGIGNHIGHFIIESMATLAEVTSLDKCNPFMLWVGEANLPEGIKGCLLKDIESIVKIFQLKNVIKPETDEIYFVKHLLFPEKPIKLSHSCEKPWQMTPLIEEIVKRAVKKYPMKYVETLYLSRFNEKVIDYEHVSNPNEPLLKQISRIYHARNLVGQIGSNTHMAIFSKYDTGTLWLKRESENSGHYEETYRNQAIVDLVKTYNKFNF